MRKRIWLRASVTIMSMGRSLSPSAEMRPSSPRLLAGTITVNSSPSSFSNRTLRTLSRKPSVAAIARRSGLMLTSTPVRVGRLSLVAAAKTTWSTILRRPSVSRVMRLPSRMGCPLPSPSAVGMMGNSAASMPRMLASYWAQRRCRVWVRTVNSMSMRSAGRLLTNSLNSLAGMVVDPSSSTLAPIQQLMPISRLVAARRSWPSLASSKMLPKTGNVLRDETARLTIDRPLARFS